MSGKFFLSIRDEYEKSFPPVDVPTIGAQRTSIPNMLKAAAGLNEAQTALVAHRALARRIQGAPAPSVSSHDLAGVMTIARFLADCLEEYAERCLEGSTPSISSFDSAWHRQRIIQIGDNS